VSVHLHALVWLGRHINRDAKWRLLRVYEVARQLQILILPPSEACWARDRRIRNRPAASRQLAVDARRGYLADGHPLLFVDVLDIVGFRLTDPAESVGRAQPRSPKAWKGKAVAG
jgi:hypothetical protein